MDEIKNYFTDDIRATIRGISNEDMKNSLKSLEGTPIWFAILKYTQDRIGVIQDSFLTLDPDKGWYQNGSLSRRYHGNVGFAGCCSSR